VLVCVFCEECVLFSFWVIVFGEFGVWVIKKEVEIDFEVLYGVSEDN